MAAFFWSLRAEAHVTNPALATIGYTPAQVYANFTTIINRNLAANGSKLNNLTDLEWQALAYMYQRRGGSLATLDSYVQVYAPAHYARYKIVSRTAGAPVPPNTTDELMYTMYLEFRTANGGLVMSEVAVFESSVAGGGILYDAYEFGTLIGQGTYWLLETFDPALPEFIGWGEYQIVNYVDTNITAIENAPSAFLQGREIWAYQSGMFGIPAWDFPGYSSVGTGSEDFGDFGILDYVSIADIDGGFCINPGDC